MEMRGFNGCSHRLWKLFLKEGKQKVRNEVWKKKTQTKTNLFHVPIVMNHHQSHAHEVQGTVLTRRNGSRCSHTVSNGRWVY